VPNSCGRFESRFSIAYDISVGSSAPPAGKRPSGKPIAVPRSHGFHDRAIRRASSTAIREPAAARRWRPRLATHSVSPIAKSPMATMTGSMPSSRYGMPNVNRACR
jgi:hypothetical protein